MANVSANVDPAWLQSLNYHEPFVTGGLFILTATLALGYAAYLLHHRALNHRGGLLFLVFFLSFLFCGTRSLLTVAHLHPHIPPILSILECTRHASICSLFGLVFVAIVRSSETEYQKTSALSKFGCLFCIIFNYLLGLSIPLSRHFFPSESSRIVNQAIHASIDVYFITVFLILGLAYICIFPRLIRNTRIKVHNGMSVKSKHGMTGTIIGLLTAFFLLLHTTLLLGDFLVVNFIEADPQSLLRSIRHWQQLWLACASLSEALLTTLMVSITALLITTPNNDGLSQTDSTHTYATPESQGLLLYPGRSVPMSPAAYRSPTNNGFYTMYKGEQ
ncbi:hypothetical protein RvY_06826 [Ramazzottius varieornatus]|uniref:Uncharacterized protein n=1 Tax=Ramazzottius varieornatus TaxID=947166 RepID=A0A1D1V096_RAMVA|nr:hypothetical protein RvY_06826 [Ramazzottius varieornatus]